MNETNATSECPHCGHPLTRDVLTGELRPCTNCGSMIGSINEKAEFEPEHQERIRKQKMFEIGIVVILIVVGVVYLSTFSKQPLGSTAQNTTAEEFRSIFESKEYKLVSEKTSTEKQFHSYQRTSGVLEHDAHLVIPARTNEIEAFIISASVPAGKEYPDATTAQQATQKSFNLITRLAESLLPASTLALEKAAATMTAGNGEIQHQKGVAQTTGGWKVTYIMYRESNDSGLAIPLLLFIYQDLDAASSPDSESFNRFLYNGINNGKSIQSIIDLYISATESTSN
jgi:hypothetical protein